MGQYKRGMPWLRFENHLPRLFLHERNEKRVRWFLRGLSTVGIVTSVLTLPWCYSLSLSFTLVVCDAFLERTLFYYTSMYVNAMPDWEYDPGKWVANAFVYPSDPSSEQTVGLVFSDAEYARRFFDLLRAWNQGSSDNEEGNICLSFITDGDAYYVYLYPSFDKSSIKKMHTRLEDENKLTKYGKKHFGLVMAMIICKGFSATNGYALGTFVDNHPVDKPFLLRPFIQIQGSPPQPLAQIEPIRMYQYKAKTADELTESDFEYQYRQVVAKRTGLGGVR